MKGGENPIVFKSKFFAVKSIELYKFLCESSHEFTLSRQFLKSSTSIGANVKEAIRGQSNADFGAKMNIALKEASESEYWLELFYDTGYIGEDKFNELYPMCQELIKMLTSIVKTTLNNLNK